MFPTTPGLDQDLGMLLDSPIRDEREAAELSEYYTTSVQQSVQGNDEISVIML